jgi:hypothetical protein
LPFEKPDQPSDQATEKPVGGFGAAKPCVHVIAAVLPEESPCVSLSSHTALYSTPLVGTNGGERPSNGIESADPGDCVADG